MKAAGEEGAIERARVDERPVSFAVEGNWIPII